MAVQQPWTPAADLASELRTLIEAKPPILSIYAKGVIHAALSYVEAAAAAPALAEALREVLRTRGAPHREEWTNGPSGTRAFNDALAAHEAARTALRQAEGE